MAEIKNQKQMDDIEEIEPMVEALTAEYLQSLEASYPMPRPIPIPMPWLTRSRFRIWKQDPSVGALGYRLSYIPSIVLNGPRDSRLQTKLTGTTPVNRSSNGDFIFTPKTPESDCAHTFAVVRMTLTMYERANGGNPIPWVWNSSTNTDPIVCHPRAGVGANAYYSRSSKCLKFLHFKPSGWTKEVYTCRSLDIVAHETGHAILDGLKPGWLGWGNPPQTGGLHESFGDLSAIFLALSQLDQIEALIAMTKANLHRKNFLAKLAEQFGAALGRPMGLRNADNNLKLSQVSNQVHDISRVFTGGIYDVMADIFEYEKRRQYKVKDPAHILLEVNRDMCQLVFNAMRNAPATAATYTHVVNEMLKLSHARKDPKIYRTFIRNRFTFREVVVSPVPLTAMENGMVDYDNANFIEGKDLLEMEIFDHASLHAQQDRSGCCGTMQLPEYMLGDQEKLAASKPIDDEELLAEEIKNLKKVFKNK
jgi:hypothetical protein